MTMNECEEWEIVSPSPASKEVEQCASSGNQISEQDFRDGSLSRAQIAIYQKCFDRDSTGAVAQNAATERPIFGLTKSRKVVQSSLSPYFSIDLGSMPATNQQDSGRCWMFGALNLFRFGTSEKLNVENFEFSESYLYLFYKLELANFFFERIIEWKDRPLSDRQLSGYLDCPIDDGGDWGIAVALIDKYGLVPKSYFPESHSSANTDNLIDMINQLLQSCACQMRKNAQHGDSIKSLRVYKEKVLNDVYRILTIHLGTPPESFDWKWCDEEGNFRVVPDISPKEFCKSFVTTPYKSYVALVQDPRHEYYQRYTTKNSLPIEGSGDLVFVNIPAEEMKQTALKMLHSGNPVYFACNVGEELDNEDGLWDANLYNNAGFYGLDSMKPSMTKAEKIEFGGTMGSKLLTQSVLCCC